MTGLRTIIRAAVRSDVPALNRMIADSARALGPPFYSIAETEAAIAHVFGVDSSLVEDGTYLVAEVDGVLAGCGGWSRQRTLFGGDRFAGRQHGFLDPATEAARIRAFFVKAAFARKGVGSVILNACETAARRAGFSTTTLMATLPGVPFYRAHHYVEIQRVVLALGGVDVSFVQMHRRLAAP
jgi:GNAT superfamily N-acetyltransferase